MRYDCTVSITVEADDEDQAEEQLDSLISCAYALEDIMELDREEQQS